MIFTFPLFVWTSSSSVPAVRPPMATLPESAFAWSRYGPVSSTDPLDVRAWTGAARPGSTPAVRRRRPGDNGWMPGYRRQLYRDDAVVLRAQKLGESDRIITLLTRRHGRLRAVARGVRRTSSRFGARLEPFGHVDLQLAGDPEGNIGSPLHTVSQVEGLHLYGKRFLDDYPRYTAASAIAETADRLTPVEREPSLRLFLLTLGALRALADGEHASTLVLDAYLLRGMGLAGWAPALGACAVCGTPGVHRAFSVPAGGSVCPDCRPPGAAHPAPATIDLMSALASGDWRVADTAEPASRRECSGLVAAHLQWYLERGLRSLPLVDRGTGDDRVRRSQTGPPPRTKEAQ